MTTANQEIFRAYADGDSLSDLSHRFGGAPVTWWRFLRKHGITMRPRGVGSDETRQRRTDVLALYGAGLTQAEIARRLSASQTAVWRVINDARRISR